MKKLADGTKVEDSVPTKNTSKGRVRLTQEEIDARNAEIEAAKISRQQRAEKAEMRSLEKDIPSALEEVIEALDTSTKAKLSKGLKDKLARKKELRGK